MKDERREEKRRKDRYILDRPVKKKEKPIETWEELEEKID